MATPEGREGPVPAPTINVERVQTGVRIEKRILKVLKATAEYNDVTLGDLLEGIVLHAFEGKAAFDPESLARIADFGRIYGLDLDCPEALTSKSQDP
jgi:hypothetical protein